MPPTVFTTANDVEAALNRAPARTLAVSELRKRFRTGNSGDAKKRAKQAVADCLEELGAKVKVTEDGASVTLVAGTRKRPKDDGSDDSDSSSDGDSDGSGSDAAAAPKEKKARVAEASSSAAAADVPGAFCADNPGRVTRLFVGNLPWAFTEEALAGLLGKFSHIKYITDKDSQQFYGSVFVEMASVDDAGRAVGATGRELLGRNVRVNFAPPREGRDEWPPEKHYDPRTDPDGAHGGSGGGGGGGGKALATNRPNDASVKLFAGNLSYDIDDDAVKKFFADCGEIVGIRYLSWKETGQFKGCGYIQFADGASAEKASKKNGEKLMGRPIRLDWAES